MLQGYTWGAPPLSREEPPQAADARQARHLTRSPHLPLRGARSVACGSLPKCKSRPTSRPQALLTTSVLELERSELQAHRA